MSATRDLRYHLRETALWYGGLGLLSIRVARNLTLPPSYFWLVAREIDIIGVRSAVVALTAALFTGMVLALQSAVNMARFGAENYVGPVVALSILRELGPVLTAILVGGKVASGITAELGSMKVTEQIDALRALGVGTTSKTTDRSPIHGRGAGLPARHHPRGRNGPARRGMLIAVFDRNVDPYLYWNTIAYWVVLKDFLTGLARMLPVKFGCVTLRHKSWCSRATRALASIKSARLVECKSPRAKPYSRRKSRSTASRARQRFSFGLKL